MLSANKGTKCADQIVVVITESFDSNFARAVDVLHNPVDFKHIDHLCRVSLRCLCWPTRSSVDAASMFGKRLFETEQRLSLCIGRLLGCVGLLRIVLLSF